MHIYRHLLIMLQGEECKTSLLKLEEQMLVSAHKFGVIYAKDNQITESELFSNRNVSSDKFIKRMLREFFCRGKRWILWRVSYSAWCEDRPQRMEGIFRRPWHWKYARQLFSRSWPNFLSEHLSDGEKSVFTQWKGLDIMFHVRLATIFPKVLHLTSAVMWAGLHNDSIQS